MKIIKPLIKTSGMTLVSRVLGFFRDILIAASLGAGGIADVFFVAMRFQISSEEFLLKAPSIYLSSLYFQKKKQMMIKKYFLKKSLISYSGY
jgi:peptidoglycan biosynthesis protein MviN/MurJ (putative lipid II flippase)